MKQLPKRQIMTENHIFSFEDLDVYKKARALVKEIYKIQDGLPKEERFGLCDQLRRASISISANIAEGSGRKSLKEKIHFIEIAYGSLMEVFCELQTAVDLGYATEQQIDYLRPIFTDTAKMLSGLRSSFITKMAENSITNNL